jgi:hypothetical protein
LIDNPPEMVGFLLLLIQQIAAQSQMIFCGKNIMFENQLLMKISKLQQQRSKAR